MPTVYIDGKQHRLSPAAAIGKGGEADVFKLDDQRALKLFKAPDHPDLKGLPAEQRGAKERLKLHQSKLPAFPAGLPSKVITPLQLAHDKQGSVVGYTMALLDSTVALKRYGERAFREGNIDTAHILELFENLHETVSGLHAKQVIIGDFNDLNVLVKDREGYFIDADSMQFGPYMCAMYTMRFVDPTLCDPTATVVELNHPYNELSDWYAYGVLLMQSLLYVDPYGGIYRPKDRSKAIPHPQRPLRRITVFHPDVQYPRPAVPYEQLPLPLLDYFKAMFEQDQREVFPVDLLDYRLWTVPPSQAVWPLPSLMTVSDKVTARIVFETSGFILDVARFGNRLIWLYHQDDQLRRENDYALVKGKHDPNLRAKLHGHMTVLARDNQLLVLDQDKVVDRQSVAKFGPLPLVATNNQHRYWIDQGKLWRDDHFGPKVIGQVLDAQTMFWVGEHFGLGLTRAGQLQYVFVFDAEHTGINDTLDFVPVNGHLFDVACCFSTELVWLLMAVDQGGQEYRRAVVYDRSGKLLADETFPATEDHWLYELRGNAAAGQFLLASTDDGVVRIEINRGKLALTRQFTETAPYVDRTTRLVVANDGLYAVNRQQIVHLQL